MYDSDGLFEAIKYVGRLHVCVCMCVCVCVHVFVCVCMCVYAHMCVYMCPMIDKTYVCQLC